MCMAINQLAYNWVRLAPLAARVSFLVFFSPTAKGLTFPETLRLLPLNLAALPCDVSVLNLQALEHADASVLARYQKDGQPMVMVEDKVAKIGIHGMATSTSFWSIFRAFRSCTPTPYAPWAMIYLVPMLVMC